jgi:hypothetical protein
MLKGRLMIIYRGYTDKGTFGRWYTDTGKFICYSMEREWKDNQLSISCIPEGDYGLREYSSVRFPNTFVLVNHEKGVGINTGEAHRSHILIHAANTPNELEGCIAPGMMLENFGHRWGVGSSKVALAKVLEVAEKETMLSIRAARALWPHKP